MRARCPECGDYSVRLTLNEGRAEYLCTACGHCFTEAATETFYFFAWDICANCKFFDWAKSMGSNAGACSSLGHEVDGEDPTCAEFIFDPPCCRSHEETR